MVWTLTHLEIIYIMMWYLIFITENVKHTQKQKSTMRTYGCSSGVEYLPSIAIRPWVWSSAHTHTHTKGTMNTWLHQLTYYMTVFCGSGFQEWLSWRCWPRWLRRLQSSCGPWLWSSEARLNLMGHRVTPMTDKLLGRRHQFLAI
jgi:hypothetical protein